MFDVFNNLQFNNISPLSFYHLCSVVFLDLSVLTRAYNNKKCSRQSFPLKGYFLCRIELSITKHVRSLIYTIIICMLTFSCQALLNKFI